MQIPVLIEPVAGNGYRAKGIEPLGLCAEGSTREEALGKLREQLQARLRNGTELVSLEVATPAAGNPWTECAGMFKDDPWLDDWKQAMAEYRQQVEEDPDYP